MCVYKVCYCGGCLWVGLCVCGVTMGCIHVMCLWDMCLQNMYLWGINLCCISFHGMYVCRVYLWVVSVGLICVPVVMYVWGVFICGNMSEICISVGMCLWHVCLWYDTCQRVACHGKFSLSCWTQCSGYCHLWGVILTGTTMKYGEWDAPYTYTLLHTSHCKSSLRSAHRKNPALPGGQQDIWVWAMFSPQFFLKPRKDPLAPPWLSTFPWPNPALCNLAQVVTPLFPFRGHFGSFFPFSLLAAFALVFGFQKKLKTHFWGK